MYRKLAVLACACALILVPAVSAFAQEVVGNAVIRDTVTTGDTLVVNLSGVSPAAPGSHYEGWLRSADGSQRLSLGTIGVEGDGSVNFTYTSPRSENLIGANTVFEMSVEPDGDADPNPSGTVAYRGQLADAMVPAVRELLFRWPSSRFGTPSGPGLVEDALLLDATAAQLVEAANGGDLGGAKRLAERLVNTVEGQNGANFGDHNGDGQAEGPGDGTGALNFAWGTYWRAKVATAAVPDDTWVAAHAGHVSGSVEQQVVNRLAEIRDQGLQFQGVSDMADAQQRAQSLRDAAARTLNGFDANGDGVVDPTAGEGGAIQILEHGQLMSAFRVAPV